MKTIKIYIAGQPREFGLGDNVPAGAEQRWPGQPALVLKEPATVMAGTLQDEDGNDESFLYLQTETQARQVAAQRTTDAAAREESRKFWSANADGARIGGGPDGDGNGSGYSKVE